MWRPYRSETAPLEGISVWLDRYRDQWEDRFGRLDEELRRIQHTTEGERNHE